MIGQNISKGKIVYKASLNTELYILQLMYDTEMSDFLRNVRLQKALESKPMNFFLLFDNNESLYHAEFDLNMQRDMGLGMNLTGMVAGVDYICYSNLKTKENFRQSFWMDNIIINVKPIVWELTKETKKIDEYTCYKATTILKEEKENGGYLSDFIVAWYTNQIPVPFGIQNFGGLPGLALELTQNTERGILFYKATNIELNSNEKILIKKPKGKGISHEEFIEIIRRPRK